jgi:regulatory protein
MASRSPDRSGTPRSAKDAALSLLARREHSQRELRNKLRRLGFEEEAIAEALTALAGDGYQSDSRTAQARIDASLRRGHGPVRIRAELDERGLRGAGGVIDQDTDWLAAARSLIDRKFGDEPPADAREYARRARFLQARGYTGDVIRKALAR